MADSSENSPTPTYRGEPLYNARGDSTVRSPSAFLTLQTNRRFRPLFRLTALLVIQAFLVFDLAWAGGSVPMASTLRGQSAEQSQAQAGLEEELKDSTNQPQTIQPRRFTGPMAWLATAILMLGFSSQSMAQDPSVPVAPISLPPVTQGVQQLQGTHQVAPSNLELTKALRGDGLTTFYFSWATRSPSGELADLQARYPDKKKVQVVYVQLVDGLEVRPAWKVQSGDVEWGRMTFSTFWRVFPWGQGRSSYISSFPYALVVDKDGSVAVMDDSKGLVTYLDQRVQAEEQREAELRRIEAERAKQEAQRKAEVEQRAEQVRRKAQADVERLQKERKELTTQLQKLREEIEPLRKMVERLKELPKVLQQEIRKLEEQKRQADQAVKELEAKRSAVQAETKKLEEKQARLAKEVGQAKEGAARAREEAVRVASQQPPAGPVVEAPGSSTSWPWLLLAGGVGAVVGAGVVIGGKRVYEWVTKPKEPPEPPEPPLGEPLTPAGQRAQPKPPADVVTPPGEELPPVAAPTPTTGAAGTLQEQPREPEKVDAMAEPPTEAAPQLGEIPLPAVGEPSREAKELRAYYKSEERARRGEPPNPDEDWLQAESEFRAEASTAKATHIEKIKEAIRTYDPAVVSNAFLLAKGEGVNVSNLDKPAAQEFLDRLRKQSNLTEVDAEDLLHKANDELEQKRREAEDRQRAEQKEQDRRVAEERAQKIRDAQPKVGQLVERFFDDNRAQPVLRTAQVLSGKRLFNEGPHVSEVLKVAEELELDSSFITPRAVEQAISTVRQRRKEAVAKRRKDQRESKLNRATEELLRDGNLKNVSPRSIYLVVKALREGKEIEQGEPRKVYEVARNAVRQFGISGDEIPVLLDKVYQSRRDAIRGATKQVESPVADGVQALGGATQVPSEQLPIEWIQEVQDAVRVRAEQAGQTSPAEYYALVVAEVSGEPDASPALLAALKDPVIARVAESQNQPLVDDLKDLVRRIAEQHQVPPAERTLLGQALGVEFPQGIGFFRWVFDPVARALRKFSDQEQQTLLAEIDTLRADARRIVKEAGVNKPRLNQVLTGIVQKAATAADARQGLTALRTLLEKLIPKAQEAARSQSGYTSPLVKWDQIPFPTLLDQAAQLSQQGAEFDVEFISERGHTEYEESGYPPSTTTTFVIDQPQSVRLIVQQPPEVPPIPEPPTPPVLDHQFLKGAGVLDALRNEWPHLAQPFLSNQARLAVRNRIGQHKLKEAAVWFDASGTGLLPGYVALSALGQEVVIRVFRPENRRLLTSVQTLLVHGEITPELHYEVFPRSEFDAMLSPDGFSDWAIVVPPVFSLDLLDSLPKIDPALVRAVPEETAARLAREFPPERLLKAAYAYSPRGQAEVAEVIDRRKRVRQLVKKLREAGIAATPERLQSAAMSLTTQSDLLIGSEQETLILWAMHRIAAELIGSDDPSRRLALFNEAVGASASSEVEVAAVFDLGLAQMEEVKTRAQTLGVQADEVYSALQRAVWIATVASKEAIVGQVDGRNWLWRTAMDEERNLVLARIQAIQDRLLMILETLGQAGEGARAPVSVYAMGGAVWSDEPNDLDLFVIVYGARPYEIRNLSAGPGELPLHMRVIGVDTLRAAVSGQPVENRANIRLEATNLYGSGVLIAGTDLFAQTRPPEENLAPVAQHYRKAIQWLQTTPDVTEEQRLSKVERWIRELQVIEQELAEHRERAQEAFVRQKMDELTQSITRLDEGLRRYFVPPVRVADEQPAVLIIPREALVEGVGVVSLRRLHETHRATVIVVAGNFTGEEKALLRGLDPKVQFIEGVTVSDPASAARVLETARSAAWWIPDVPARVLVPTSDLNARPMELPAGRLLYYLAPDEAHLISLGILLQATHQDLFQPNFPVVQVILARIPIEAAGLKDQVYDFRERWALAAGA